MKFKTISSIEDVILICAELKDMAFEPYEFYDKWTPEQRDAHKVKIKQLDKLGFELLADLLNSRKVTQKQYWDAYFAWFDLWNHDLPCWGNDADCDYEWEDDLYDKYNPIDPDAELPF